MAKPWNPVRSLPDLPWLLIGRCLWMALEASDESRSYARKDKYCHDALPHQLRRSIPRHLEQAFGR